MLSHTKTTPQNQNALNRVLGDEYAQEVAPEESFTHPVNKRVRRGTKGNRAEQNKRWYSRHKASRRDYMRRYMAAKRRTPIYFDGAPC